MCRQNGDYFRTPHLELGHLQPAQACDPYEEMEYPLRMKCRTPPVDKLGLKVRNINATDCIHRKGSRDQDKSDGGGKYSNVMGIYAFDYEWVKGGERLRLRL